jgi:hypothetical protein
MNLYDWYFAQLISQDEMDQAFAWVTDALERWTQDALSDPTDPGGGWNGGILEGGAVTQQTVPDLSVRVSAVVAYDKIGRPVIDATAQQTVPVDVDEYGTTTAVAASGNSKILSVFLRYKLNPQDPAVDGNGLTVYTKQLDDTEIFVRQSAEAVTPTAPPLLPDALLLADISMAYGQTTVLTGHIDASRREDWLRLVGTTITSFVAGTPREALRQLFDYVDTAIGGGSAYTPNYTWAGAVPLGTVGGAPPTTSQTGLDAIVQDLADNATGGDSMVGALAITGTAGGRGDQGSGTVAGQLAALAGLIASHTAACVQATARAGWAWINLSNLLTFTPGTITNAAGGTCVAVAALDVLTSPWVLVHTLAGTWTVGDGIDYGGAYVAAEAYYNGRVDLQDVLTATDLQTILHAAAAELARNGGGVSADTLYAYGQRRASGVEQGGVTLGGACTPGGPPLQLGLGESLDDDDPCWSLPYQTYISCAAGTLVDICAGWDYARNAGCAYLVGANLVVSKLFVDPTADLGIAEESADLTIDASGTLMSTLGAPPRVPYAVASNGVYLFVLVSSGAAGSAAEVYAYDARLFRAGGTLQWVWTAVVPFTTNCLGTTKWRSNLVANNHYVVALLGGEDCNTGSPLCRIDALTGLNATLGAGDGASVASFKPCGGLAISRATSPTNHVIMYTAENAGAVTYQAIPAAWDLSATGKGQMVLVDRVRDVVIVGGYALFPEEDNGNAGMHFTRAWHWEVDDQAGVCLRVEDSSATYPLVRAAFDGTNIWLKLCHALAGEQHVVTSVHPAELVQCGSPLSQQIFCDHRYLVSPPKATGVGAGGDMGRFVAFGPGIWSIWHTSSDACSFLPLNRGVR